MMSLDRLKSMGGYRAFYLRRFFRIAPLWWISVAIMFVYNCFVRNEIGSIGSVISHIFALHGLFPQYIGDIIGQGWSVSIEVLFYLFVPLIIKVCKDKLDNYVKFIFGASIIVYVLNLIGDKLLKSFLPEIDSPFFYLWLPNQLVAFLIGICLYLIIIKGKTIEDWRNSGKYMIGIICLCFLSISEVLTKSLIEAAVVLILSKYASKIVNNKIFRYIGKVSYGVYLSHMLVILILQDFGLLSYGRIISLMLYFIAVPLISIGIGTITYHLIEKPMLKIERRIENKISK